MVRVLNCGGIGSFTQVIAGVDWVTAHAIKPAVANMSLGGGISSSLDSAVNNSIASGVTYAIAAGNSNNDACLSSPADVPNAITVGSTGNFQSPPTPVSDARSSFSNFGPCVDLFAPGAYITSDWDTGTTATNVISGTSMATPHVAGIVARYLSTTPCATPADVANAIVDNATTGHVGNLGAGSPDLLLYSGFLGPDAPIVPGAPCRPTATAAGGNNTVHLAWLPNPGGSAPTSFNVYRGTTARR